jgi:hypothetical protein
MRIQISKKTFKKAHSEKKRAKLDINEKKIKKLSRAFNAHAMLRKLKKAVESIRE